MISTFKICIAIANISAKEANLFQQFKLES